ncbi:MAG: helix-turn-helix domain-containing protein [Thermoproteales archaeon]|nr:helix-turn-helix domain-containing protein [Thermoproteales archaeon]
MREKNRWFFTLEEVCERTGLKKEQLKRLIRKKVIKAIKLPESRVYLIPADELYRILQLHKVFSYG